MPSNTWTERKRLLRRPIVCKSKKKIEEAIGNYAVILGPAWVIDEPAGPSDYSGPEIGLTNVPNTNTWIAAWFDDQGNAVAATLILGALTLPTAIEVLVSSGATPLYLLGAVDTPWPGTLPYQSPGTTLSLDGVGPVGTVNYQVQAL